MSDKPSPTTRAYVFDLDGVLYRGDEAVDGAAETLARLRARGDAKLYFLTNNSSQTRQTYIDKLTRMGMPCTFEEIVTSASATAAYLVEVRKAQPGAVVLCVGGPGIADEMTRVGLTPRSPREPDVKGEKIDFVVAGLDRAFDYATLDRAMQAILSGAAFVATNRDHQFPMEGGRVIPGGGAMVAAIEAASDTTPAVVGKPEAAGLQTILRHAGCTAAEALMIGDRLDTDIACGNRIGVPTALVLTGVTSEETARKATGDQVPGRIMKDLRELV